MNLKKFIESTKQDLEQEIKDLKINLRRLNKLETLIEEDKQLKKFLEIIYVITTNNLNSDQAKKLIETSFNNPYNLFKNLKSKYLKLLKPELNLFSNYL